MKSIFEFMMNGDSEKIIEIMKDYDIETIMATCCTLLDTYEATHPDFSTPDALETMAEMSKQVHKKLGKMNA